jgi:hypothetical protein
MSVKDLKEDKKLLSKKDFIEIIENNSIADIRELFRLTHKIKGQYRNYSGHCFKCLTPLRADYTHNKNYCLDC